MAMFNVSSLSNVADIRRVFSPRIQDPAERKLKLTTELNNGRLALRLMGE
jgi:hypothetical protein